MSAEDDFKRAMLSGQLDRNRKLAEKLDYLLKLSAALKQREEALLVDLHLASRPAAWRKCGG